jgi:hypothetical protein
VSPVLTLFIAAVSAPGYVIFSGDLTAAYSRHDLVPVAWLGERDRKQRPGWLFGVEVIWAVFVVAMTQFLLVSIAVDATASFLTRAIAVTELLVALAWTGYVVAVVGGLDRALRGDKPA